MPKVVLDKLSGLAKILSTHEVFYDEEELKELERNFHYEIKGIHNGGYNNTDYIIIEMRNGLQLPMLRDPINKKYYLPEGLIHD